MTNALMIMAANYKTPPAEVTGNVSTYLGWFLWLLMVIAVGRLMWIGGKLGWHRWQGTPDESEPMVQIISLIVGGILAGTAGAWAVFMVGG
ncbi:hypothetical protein [Corynebacterium suicordis]|uniref:Uncharacterized protein n=1 Tax=Corynebacterium suicordis DSM 45110 TaxID=1121369 RepID=A0ABR9ZLW5_9CORY|nr:hypothetical protein [Corynebacterium suicordis]MBF4554377.1 hypothetical protein [Corynebacterium suicordis DSM 45110]MDR6278599.1 hypothetical protein [Corynebacterium suicordis]